MVCDGHVLCTCMVMFSQSDHLISHNFFKKVNIVSHILKFLHKFNDSYDNFFQIFNKIEHVIIFVVWYLFIYFFEKVV